MAFLDELRAYLEERPDKLPPAFTPNIAAHRRHLIEALEALERKGSNVEHLPAWYSSRLDTFVAELGQLLLEGLAHGAGPEEVGNAHQHRARS